MDMRPPTRLERRIFAYGASLAWRTGLLLPDNDALYATAVQGNVTIDRSIERSGCLAETQIAFGSTFKIDGPLELPGLPKVFEEQSTHRESTVDVPSDLAQWRLDESWSISGQGVLLRFGGLLRVRCHACRGFTNPKQTHLA